MKFLIIQQKMIGDVLTSTVLCEALKIHYPQCKTHYVINYNTVAVVENNPFIDKLIVIDKTSSESSLQLLKFAKKLKKDNYHAVIDVYGKLSSLIFSYFSKSKNKIAYHKTYNSFIYNHTIERISEPVHDFSLAIENRMRLLKPLDIAFKKLMPKIYLTDAEIKNGKTFLINNRIDLDRKIYMISVLGSGMNKTYPFEYMANLLDALVEMEDCQILFNYIPNQLKDAKAIYDKSNSKTQNAILFDVYAKDLRSFLAVTKHCDAVIGNEGGANNMAKALDVPTFTIFAPYLNKQNWFGENEEDDHVAVHVSDFVQLSESDLVSAKKEPEPYYKQLKPEMIIPKLKSFTNNLN